MNLNRISKCWLDEAVARHESTGEDVRTFHSFLYKAVSWKHRQGVVAKTEVNNLGTNIPAMP